MKKACLFIFAALIFNGCKVDYGKGKAKKITWNEVAKEAKNLEQQKNATIKVIGEKEQ